MSILIQNPKVSIVIVNWNGYRWLKQCIDSLQSQTYDNLEIIIVDNNSSDDSVRLIKEEYSFVKLILNKKNQGFSLGNNQGAQISAGDFLFFLNTDTQLFPNCITELVKTYQIKKQIGAVGCTIYDRQEKVCSEICKIDRLGYPIRIPNKKNNLKIIPTFFVSGSSLLITKELFIKLGGFDETIFMYMEDVDLCWRLKLMGYNNYINTDAKLYHFGGGSSIITNITDKHLTTRLRILQRERYNLYILLKNYSLKNLILYVPIYLLLNIFEMIFFLILGKPVITKLYLQSWIWNLNHIRSSILNRSKVQAQRVVSDKSIMQYMHKGVGKLTSFFTVGVPRIL